MAPPINKRYSNIRYWRYVFTPLVLLTALFGLFVLFSDSADNYNAPTLFAQVKNSDQALTALVSRLKNLGNA